MGYKPDKAKEIADRMDAIGRAEMVRLAQELHGGKYAPSMAEYEAFAIDEAGTKTFISKRYPGGWEVFAAACGLEMAEYEYYYYKAKERRAEWDALQKHGCPSAKQVGAERDAMMRDTVKGVIVSSTPRRDTWYSNRDGKVYEGLAWMMI